MLKTLEKNRVMASPQPLCGGDRIQTQFARSTTLDWQILREDEPWQEPVALPDSTASGASFTRRHVRGIGSVAGLLFVLGAGALLYLWRTAESGAQRLEDELRATVAAELWPTPQPHTGQADRDVLAPIATVQVQDITFQGNVVIVQVETTYTDAQGQVRTARQRAFYQPTEAGWQRYLLTLD